MRFGTFDGHFPGDPIVPGAALLRAVEREAGPFLRLERVRFLGVVRPDEDVEIEASSEGERVRFRMRRGDSDVLRGSAIRGQPAVNPGPLRVVPTLARPIWAGDRLANGWGKDPAPGARVGESWEVWRENRLADGRRLGDVVELPLVKLLDVRETLSVQVHPDDSAARAAGHPHGKHEAWVVIGAEPGAKVALGLRGTLSVEELRARALSGAIEADLAWREVAVGDVLDVPPGTIHAIGGGVMLYEVQQPCDLTWRLYDWGRGRTLHLEEALGVVIGGPATAATGRWDTLFRTPHFSIERVRFPAHRVTTAWESLTVVEGHVSVSGVRLALGETALLPPGEWTLEGEGIGLLAGR